MNLAQYSEDLVSTVDTDALVFQYQGISSYSAEDVPMYFSLFMDLNSKEVHLYTFKWS